MNVSLLFAAKKEEAWRQREAELMQQLGDFRKIDNLNYICKTVRFLLYILAVVLIVGSL